MHLNMINSSRSRDSGAVITGDSLFALSPRNQIGISNSINDSFTIQGLLKPPTDVNKQIRLRSRGFLLPDSVS
jgi:hypothetical protein